MIFLKNKIATLLLAFVLIGKLVNGQVETSISEELESERDENEIELNELLTTKISVKELLNDNYLSSMLLNAEQKNELINYLKLNGEIIDLLELQCLKNFEYKDYLKLSKFIEVEENTSGNPKATSIKIQNRSTHSNQINNSYIGSNWSNYQKIQYTKKYTSIGFAREYDIGENYSRNSFLNHYDSYTYYINQVWRNSEITIGTYQVYQGFGLVIGQGYANNFENSGIGNSPQNRWNGVANQSEINLFKGGFYSLNTKFCKINIGYSQFKKDSGTQSGLHRTAFEIQNKKKNKDSNFIISISKSTRKFNQTLFSIYNDLTKEFGISYAFSKYIRNYIIYSETGYVNNKFSNTSGIMCYLSKDVQIGITYLTHLNGYNSSWASIKTQSFSKTNKSGIQLQLNFPINSRVKVLIVHKIVNKEETFGKLNSGSTGIRISYVKSKTHKISLTSSSNYNFDTENNSENPSELQYASSSKISWEYMLNDKAKQSVQVFNSFNKTNLSTGLSYQLNIKISSWNLHFAIGQFKINEGHVIYFSSRNSLSAQQNIGVFNTSTIQLYGLQKKIKGFANIAIQYQQQQSIEKNTISKFLINIKYP